MSISSKATGLRPGVVTSSTRPTSPYTGMVVYETDTGYLRVWDGSAWDYLSQKQDDTIGLGPVGGLVLIKTQTIGSAVGNVTVTSAFSADFDNYRIIVTGGVGVGANGWTLRLGSATSAYYNAGYSITYSSGGTSALSQNFNAGQFTLAGVHTTDTGQADIELFQPYLAKRTLYKSTYIYGATAGGGDMIYTAGYQNSTTQFTDFQFTFGGSTMTGGTIAVYGYRKA